MLYLVSYQLEGQRPTVFVADDDELVRIVRSCLEKAQGAPVFVQSAKTLGDL